MPDTDPLLLRRLLELRRFPLLAGAELAELAILAENVAEVSYPRGAVIAGPALPGEVHLILSGRIDAGAQRFGEREALGWLEVLARRPLAAPAVAVEETRALRLAAGDLGELLEDNFGLLALALRELAARALELPEPGARAPRAAVPPPGALGLVERMIVLRQRPPFASAGLEALAILAYESREATHAAGEVVCRAGDPARVVQLLLDGGALATADGRAPARLGPGDVIGLWEGLAGLRHGSAILVTTPVRALEIASTTIFDVLEDHPELGLAMLETLAGGLLDATGAALLRAS